VNSDEVESQVRRSGTACADEALDVRPARFMHVGPNGAGKTTLLAR
jgi:ABC-type cobalamin transport system ATPase subunit